MFVNSTNSLSWREITCLVLSFCRSNVYHEGTMPVFCYLQHQMTQKANNGISCFQMRGSARDLASIERAFSAGDCNAEVCVSVEHTNAEIRKG